MDFKNLSEFSAISCEELDAKASLMTRRDNKYILSSNVVDQLLGQLVDDYSILQIEGKRAFTYKSVYYDSPDLISYYTHHQMRRKRFKVRKRCYVDTKICKLELKFKSTRGQTIKKRVDTSANFCDHLTPEDICFLKSYLKDYLGPGLPIIDLFQRIVDVSYRRITLVSNDGGERITLDTKLTFTDEENEKRLNPDIWIIEVKSPNGRGHADQLLKRLGNRPTKRCSKYCIALATLNIVQKKNKFARTLRAINKCIA